MHREVTRKPTAWANLLLCVQSKWALPMKRCRFFVWPAGEKQLHEGAIHAEENGHSGIAGAEVWASKMAPPKIVQTIIEKIK